MKTIILISLLFAFIAPSVNNCQPEPLPTPTAQETPLLSNQL